MVFRRAKQHKRHRQQNEHVVLNGCFLRFSTSGKLLSVEDRFRKFRRESHFGNGTFRSADKLRKDTCRIRRNLQTIWSQLEGWSSWRRRRLSLRRILCGLPPGRKLSYVQDLRKMPNSRRRVEMTSKLSKTIFRMLWHRRLGDFKLVKVTGWRSCVYDNKWGQRVRATFCLFPWD